MLKYKIKIENQVTLLAVINDVGSSMGLWLGISVFSIFEAISKVLWRRNLNINQIVICFWINLPIQLLPQVCSPNIGPETGTLKRIAHVFLLLFAVALNLAVGILFITQIV